MGVVGCAGRGEQGVESAHMLSRGRYVLGVPTAGTGSSFLQRMSGSGPGGGTLETSLSPALLALSETSM